jgi:CHAT domain-containing protein
VAVPTDPTRRVRAAPDRAQRDRLVELADLAQRRHRDPAQARLMAVAVFDATADPVVAGRAAWVVGLTDHELGSVDEAITRYEQAVELSATHPDHSSARETSALARASLAISCLSAGDTDRAEREMAHARDQSPPSSRGQIEMLYALLRQRTGHLTESMAAQRRALRSLERSGDEASIARLRLNRGALRAYQGDLRRALEDLEVSEAIADRLDLPVLAAMAAHNTGFAQGRRGDLPAALAAFDRAEAAYARLENPARLTAVLLADRCELLLLAGLVDEAGGTARAAVQAVEASGDQTHLNETHLLAARASLAQGAYPDAAREAARAADQFDAARRRPWAALARYVGIQAEVLASQDLDQPPLDLLGRSRALAVELERQGWPIEAVHVRTFVGRLALALGRPAVARRELAGAAAARRKGPAEQRAQAWHAAALLRLAEGDEPGARRALVQGMAVVERYRATLGATELRTGAAGHGSELTRLGTRLAMADDRPDRLLAWAERGRARALALPAVRPPRDEQLADDLIALRQVDTELREAAGTSEDTAALRRRSAVLEESIRRRTRRSQHPGDPSPRSRPREGGPIDLPRLRQAVGGRMLIEYLELDGILHAVTVHQGRLRHHPLGPIEAVEREKDYLLFALRQLLGPRRPDPTQRPRRGFDPDQALAQAAARLEELLLAPLRLPDGELDLIVVPTGTLYGVAWSALPGLAGRATSLAPSAAAWLGPATEAARPSVARRASTPGRGVALIAGPGLPGARNEVTRLGRLYPRAETLVGERATATAVLASFEGAEVVHLAAHGSFRADSPLFSSVRLADGPLTVYDLEQVRRAPRLVILSACEAAAVAVRSGDELLGTAATLIGLGVRQVIAPVTAVPDDATQPLMLALHRHLLAGCTPAEALARASQDQPGVAAAAFVCVGGDDRSFNAR